MTTVRILALAVVCSLACGSDDKAAAPKPKPKEKTGPTTPKVVEPKGPTADSVGAEVLARTEEWLAAQKAVDFDAYIAMYDPKYFKGIKRTTSGKVKTYDYAGWKADRGRMFEKRPTVAVENPRVVTWLDRDAKLKPNVSTVRFTQRWKTDRYADHGVKVLRFWRDPKGVHYIVYEDLLNSEPGWDRTPDANVEKLDWAAPTDSKPVLPLWKKLAPTGKDYQNKLASLPDDPELRRGMARALLAEGDFECEKLVGYASCGMGEAEDPRDIEWYEFAPISPKATFKDPCLKRRLALWALDQLTPEDMAALSKELVALFALPDPERELPAHALEVVKAADESLRFELLTAAASGRHHPLAEESIDGLSEPYLIRAARELHLTSAVKALASDPNKHIVVLAGALADEAMDIETRRELLPTLAGNKDQAVTKALISATGDADCELAMLAADALAKRGDSSYLPRRPESKKLEDHAEVLCMNVHDPDEDRSTKLWRDYVPKKGGIEIYFSEEGGGYDDEEEGEQKPKIVTREDASAEDLDEPFGKDVTCREETCVGDNGAFSTVTVHFKEIDGKLYVTRIDSYYSSGCGC